MRAAHLFRKAAGVTALFLSLWGAGQGGDGEALLVQNSARLRLALAEAQGLHGVYAYRRTLERFRGDKAGLFADRLAAMGLGEVYLSYSGRQISSSADEKAEMEAMVKALHSRGLRVLAQCVDDPLTYVQPGLLSNALAPLAAWQREMPAESRFDGATVDLEPHTLKPNQSTLPAGHTLFWDGENGWGRGGNNEALLLRTRDLLLETRRLLAPLPVFEAAGTFFHDHVAKGEAAWGRSRDFLEVTEGLLLMAYDNRTERLASMVAEELGDAPKEKSLTVCLKVSTGTAGVDGANPRTTFHGLGVDRLIQSVKDLGPTFRKAPSFRGFGFFEYEGLEKMVMGMDRAR